MESKRRKLHFLAVESDHNDAFFLKRAFALFASNATVFVCCDGKQARAYLSGERPYEMPPADAVITSFHLGGESVLDLLKWMKEQPCLLALPVFLLSSSITPAQKLAAKDLGVLGTEEKPSERGVLATILTRFIEITSTHKNQET